MLLTVWLFSLLGTPAFAGSPAFRIRAVGDIMLGSISRGEVPETNFLTSVMHETRKADLMIGNYEGTLCDIGDNDGGERPANKCTSKNEQCFAFRGPTRLAIDLRDAGFHAMSLSNNHIFDYGHACATATHRAMEDAGITPFGLLPSRRSQAKDFVKTFETANRRIALLGFHFKATGGRLISMMDVAKVTQLVSLAKASHDFVVVSVHYGAEGPSYVNSPHSDENYFGENRGNMRAFSKIAIDAGADLVMGHGPHVLRGLELYKNKLIVHSLGNFATYSGFLLDPVSRLGAIVDVGLDDNGDFLDGQIISTHQFYERTPSGKRGQIRLEIDRKKRAAQQIAILTNKDFEMRPVIRSDGSFFRDRSN